MKWEEVDGKYKKRVSLPIRMKYPSHQVWLRPPLISETKHLNPVIRVPPEFYQNAVLLHRHRSHCQHRYGNANPGGGQG